MERHALRPRPLALDAPRLRPPRGRGPRRRRHDPGLPIIDRRDGAQVSAAGAAPTWCKSVRAGDHRLRRHPGQPPGRLSPGGVGAHARAPERWVTAEWADEGWRLVFYDPDARWEND